MRDLAFSPIADQVLDAARVRAGDPVLDVGSGAGLLAGRAASRVGPGGLACALDVDHDALVQARAGSARLPGVDGPVVAVAGDASALPFPTGAFSAVVTRSALIYVVDKAGAVAEMHRVLGPGGRMSLWEPIHRARLDYGVALVTDPSSLEPDHDRVLAWQRGNTEAGAAVLGFDERDLVRWFLAAGFEKVSLRYDLTYSSQVAPAAVSDHLVHDRPDPGTPSLAEAAYGALGEGAGDYLDRLRRVLATQPATLLGAVAHLTGRRRHEA